tara:strand:- start:1294 stop:1437 length:144 start_codon:yes stop_codon:yes gene_type:complete
MDFVKSDIAFIGIGFIELDDNLNASSGIESSGLIASLSIASHLYENI